MISYCSLPIGFVRRGHPKLNFKMHVCYTLTQPGFVVRLAGSCLIWVLLPSLREREERERERERERWFMMESNCFVLLL
jgi:hypothetical protein